MNNSDQHEESIAAKKPHKVLFFFLPSVIILLAVFVAVVMVKTKPTARRQPPGERITQVTLMTMKSVAEPLVLRAAGTVTPAQHIALKPRVGGEVVWINPRFISGGRVEAGDELLRIDDSDYRFVAEIRKAELAQAELAHKLELGQQDIARHEWNLIENRDAATPLDEALALRGPHLKSAEAKLESAKAALERAELDLARTHIKAPFNGVVISRDVDIGEQVSTQTQLGRLAGTDEYWIEATIPVDHLKWITRPDVEGNGGAKVKVRPAGGIRSESVWEGRVLEVRPDLESKGRLAQLLLSVRDPLDVTTRPQNDIPLLLGSYVRVEIEGPAVEGVFRLPSPAIHDGATVWLMVDERLQIRPVGILWRNTDTVLINDGLADGDLVVVSDIAAPVPGMRLEEEHPLTVSGIEKPDEAHKQ